MKMFRKDEGFTLVELMVVVLIIGILVAIAIPVFNVAKLNAQRKSCYANMRTVSGAYQTWAADQTGAVVEPADFAALMTDLKPDFVKTTPVCPAAGVYSASFATGPLVVSCSKTAAPEAHVSTF